MIHHSRIVLSIVTGGSVRWGTQRRKASGEFVRLARSELFNTLLGMTAALSLAMLAPGLLLWLAPIWLPLVLSIPIVLIVSSPSIGALVKRTGLMAVPSETEPDELLLRTDDLQSITKADEAARFRDLVLDPLLLRVQLTKLQAREGVTNIARADLHRLQKRALRVGPAALSEVERKALSEDPESLRTLHREAWQFWPVESWQLARDVPQLPRDARD
jgi:membrane glycosyltransferase